MRYTKFKLQQQRGKMKDNAIPVKSEIVFHPDKDKWALKITRDGIIFNRECYPNSTPDDFAQCFIDILESQFAVKFTKNGPPYDREQTVE